MIGLSKSQILARHRTLHVGHALVTDPLFAVDGFFDPRDLLLVKYEMLRRVRVDHGSVSRATRAVALSRTSWYDAMHRWERHGLIGLLPDPPGPRTRDTHTRIDSAFSTGCTDGHQKGGRILPSGIPGTKPSAMTGSVDALRVKWFSFCGKDCWPGRGQRLRVPAFTHRGITRRIALPWTATWLSPSPS